MLSAGTAAAAVVCFLALISVHKVPCHATALPGFDANAYQVFNATPILIEDSLMSKGGMRCARIPISGLSRLNLWSYFSARRLELFPSGEIPEKAYKKIHLCFHSNSSLGSCQCENDLWEGLHGGSWSSVSSPYEDKYIDVKFLDNVSGYVTVTVKIDFRRSGVIFLAIGLSLFILAPIVSSWVPFYYSSSMAIGILLVVIILLFQGMKLLPTARKNVLYSSLSVFVFGASSFLLNRLSTIVNSMLVNFGIHKEMHNPVLVFCLVGVVLAGAGFGYWLVRKFVIAEDGSVDDSVAQFVRWAIRLVAVVCVLQSTLDIPLALALLAFLVAANFTLTHLMLGHLRNFMHFVNWIPLGRAPKINKSNVRAEFLSRPKGNLWRSPSRSPMSSNLPNGGKHSAPLSRRSGTPLRTPSHSPWSNLSSGGTPSRSTDYYSSFHKTPCRRFTEEEWREFTDESTHDAVAELASTPEFAEWLIRDAGRMRVSQETDSDESIGSGSDLDDKHFNMSSTIQGSSLWQRHK